MAFQHARTAGFLIELGGTTALSNITQYVSSVDWGESRDTAETTVFATSNSQKTYVPGNIDATCSIEGSWDVTIDGILDARFNSSSPVKAIRFYPATTDSSLANFRQKKANAIMTSLSVPSGVGDANKWSAEFQISGTITKSATTV